MTRILTDGAEMGDLMLYATQQSLTNVTSATVPPRSGARCYRMSSAGTGQVSAIDIPGGALSEFYLRIGVRVPALIGGNEAFVQIRSGSTVLAQVIKNVATAHFQLVCNGVYAEGSIPILVNTWYLIEVHFKIADIGGVFDLKVDGVSDCGIAGDTKTGAYTTADNIAMITFNSTMYWDDIALNNTAGGVDASWCGDGHIVMVSPNGNGDSSMLAGSDGNSVNNYLLVDEVPPTGDADYVESLTPNDIDLYAMGNITLQPGETISRAWIESRARELAADGDSIAVGLKSGVTTDWSSNQPVTTTYVRYVSKYYFNDPDTGIPWTESGINAVQAGIKII